MLVVKKMTAPVDSRLPDGRSYVSEDVLLRVGRAGLSLAYLPSPVSEWRDHAPVFPTTMDEATCAVLGAWMDDRLVGWCAVRAGDCGWAEVTGLCVDVTCRRQGIGTLLLDACADYAASHGLHGLHIKATDTNPILCRFLERTGFELAGMDRRALSQRESERSKPMLRRACQLLFYRT